MGKFKKGLFMFVLVIAVLFTTACKEKEASSDADGEKIVLKLAHFQPGEMNQPKQAAALAFESYVESHTNGSIDVEIYPASQLGDEATTLEGLQLGSIQMTVIHDGPISSIYEPMGVFNLPYLFNNQGEAWNVFDSEYTKKIGEAMREEVGIRLLGMADNGIRHFTNDKKAITSPDDMNGMKFRVQPGKLYEELVAATGASPSVVPWPELPAALQQGVVDGQENGVTNILAASLYESQSHVTLDGHIYSYHAYLISDEFWADLTSDQQKAIQEGVDIAKWVHRGMTANQDMNAASILGEKGMTVTTLTEAEIDEFRQTTQPAVADWMRDEIGEEWVNELLDLVDSLRE